MSALRPPASTFLGIPGFTSWFARRPSRSHQTRARVEPVIARPGAGVARPQPSSAKRAEADRLLAAARVAPKLELIEWDGDQPAQPAAVNSLVQDDSDPRTYDAKRRKIRDRYVGTRFPGVAKCAGDLASAERVIKGARLYFEEDNADAALELLELAIEECPRDASLWLARLEILFLIRDATGFAATARGFHKSHPESEESWAEICRLGRALVPGESLFGAVMGPRDHEHYGPWPHTPNWIQAPWDLTADVVAVDFHRAMARMKPRAAA